jgi:hypothetical protein
MCENVLSPLNTLFSKFTAGASFHRLSDYLAVKAHCRSRCTQCARTTSTGYPSSAWWRSTPRSRGSSNVTATFSKGCARSACGDPRPSAFHGRCARRPQIVPELHARAVARLAGLLDTREPSRKGAHDRESAAAAVYSLLHGPDWRVVFRLERVARPTYCRW